MSNAFGAFGGPAQGGFQGMPMGGIQQQQWAPQNGFGMPAPMQPMWQNPMPDGNHGVNAFGQLAVNMNMNDGVGTLPGPSGTTVCFTCSTPGHWAKDCPMKPEGDLAGPICGCGQPTVARTVSKEGENKGKVFYVCPKPRDTPDRCNYFQWKDEPVQPMAEPGPPCACGVPSKTLTVRKETKNKGRQFHCCAQPNRCDFFAWTDDPTGGAGIQGGKAPMDRSTTQCYKCNQMGHWAKECPMDAGAAGFGGGGGFGQPTAPFVSKGTTFGGGGGCFSGGSSELPPPGPPPACPCGTPAEAKMSRSARNPNRWFYKAACQRDCGFFKWADEDSVMAPGKGGGRYQPY
mmetsp:Transcript_11167/g.24607  ORF Transcript_11167/g.24607 Transcript_11167/m.24607 type:complete len:345 (+) Transcript_11167:52-1086(+)